MPNATPAERRDVAAYLEAGSMKGAAALLEVSEVALRVRFSRHYRRHRVRNITELTFRVIGIGPIGT